ncbi:MAG: hypothetical protein A4E34_00999 [Methanoregula sp. PtaU1.Bin006]|nr:MAG: hypothetical protein A4E34_00999 [Methanoregula sp. PtaU1.Bin006]
MDADLLLAGKLRAPLQPVGGDCVRCMGACRGSDPRVVQRAYMADKVLCCPALGLALPSIEEVNEPVGKHCPDPRLADGPGCLLHHEVHVVECGRACPDHLEAGEFCPPVHVRRRQVGLERPDLLGEPVLQDHVVGIAAQEGHGGMSVGVDKTGKRDRPVPVDNDICLTRVLFPYTFPDSTNGTVVSDKNIRVFPVHLHIRNQDRLLPAKNIVHAVPPSSHLLHDRIQNFCCPFTELPGDRQHLVPREDAIGQPVGIVVHRADRGKRD